MKKISFFNIKKCRLILPCVFFLIPLGTGAQIISDLKSSSADINGHKNTITSESKIDWSKQTFTSDVSLDTEKAGISMPSGKKSATNTINTELPVLIKDPLLSLYVNNSQQLGDLVLENTVTLEQLTQIIDDGDVKPGVFANGTLNLKTTHTINLLNIASLMIRHKIPYKNAKPIEQVPSRKYSGIIIDARGILPVRGEFVEDSVYPCFFPQIWEDGKMDLIYERNMGNPENERKQGMVLYDWDDNESKYQDRIGLDPMHIRARKVYGELRTDPVISHEDALKILNIPENLKLLQDGKVVILLDRDKLVMPVSAPVKSDSYYTAIREIKEILRSDDEEEVVDGFDSITVLSNLQFVADSATLLPSELPRLAELATTLKKLTEKERFQILVEGHTADVNKPTGQQILSEERAKSIINALVANGLPRSIFTFRGYGGTDPIATNETAEGRAANRRVVIKAKPLARTYTQHN